MMNHLRDKKTRITPVSFAYGEHDTIPLSITIAEPCMNPKDVKFPR